MKDKTQVTETSKFGKVTRVVSSSNGGAVSLTQKISLAINLDNYDINVLPRQCALLLALLEKANGSVTMSDIVKYFESSEGTMFWGRGSNAYEQDCAKTTSYYLANLQGTKDWEHKKQEQFNGVKLIDLG
tara:strand:- start:1311 stop:1700 length:390 start_codon:yes stop_codon:yes gene_type:complete